MSSKHTTQWAEDFLREKIDDTAENDPNVVDHFLTIELQNGGFYIPEATLAAIEITKGGSPIDDHSISETLKRKALSILDDVVANTNVEGGLDIAKVSEAEQIAASPKVTDYATRIRKAHGLTTQIRQACDDDQLAESILRLLAIRPSARIQHIHNELASLANREWKAAPLRQLGTKINNTCNDDCKHIDSFLGQLASGPGGSKVPFVSAPPVERESSAEGGWSGLTPIGIVIVIIGSFFVRAITRSASETSRPPRPAIQSVDPIASMRTVEKWSSIAALRKYVQERETLPKLWGAMDILKKGIFENDQSKFLQAMKMLSDGYANKDKIAAYENLRKLANSEVIKLQNPPPEGHPTVRLEYAKWFDNLPDCEETNEDLKDLSAEKKLVMLEIRLLKTRNKEMKQFNDVFRTLLEAREK